jgi:hypothetical protein
MPGRGVPGGSAMDARLSGWARTRRLRPLRRRRRISRPELRRYRGPAPGRHERGSYRVADRRSRPHRFSGQVVSGQRSAGDDREVGARRTPAEPVEPATDPGRSDTAGHVCASRKGPRAAESSRRWVEARTVVRRGQAGGGKAPSEGEPEDGRGAGSVHVLGDRGDGRDHLRMEAIGSGVLEGGAEDGVRRLAAVVATSVSQARRAPSGAGASPGPGRSTGHPAPGRLRLLRSDRPAGAAPRGGRSTIG